MGASEVVVAGHICLDIIPAMAASGGLAAMLKPGALVNVGPPVVATGGPVSNTGLALNRLGVRVSLMGKVGDDMFGRAVLDVLAGHDPRLTEGMIVAAGECTSYSVVLNPPDVDRVFLHCTGANDTFVAADVDIEKLAGARIFHFGYPPLMRAIYSDGGEQLAALLGRVRRAGVTTSLDMAFVDPSSEAGRVDWAAWLERVLPEVDLFAPSLDETLFMLERPRFERIRAAGGSFAEQIDGGLLTGLSQRLLAMGPAIVMLKLGDQGACLRTTAEAGRLAAAGRCRAADARAWLGRQILAPCFRVDVIGTTGSGDATIAGFLAALLAGVGPAEAMTAAVATGACNCEAADAIGGIRPWDEVQRRVAEGWARKPISISLAGWRHDPARGLYFGPRDAQEPPE